MKVKKYFSITVYILLSITTLMAQRNAAELTLEDLIPGGSSYNKYNITYPKGMQWWGDTPLYIKGDSIISIPLNEKDKSVLILDKTMPEGKYKTTKPEAISFPYANEKTILINNNTGVCIYDLENHKAIIDYNIPKQAANKDLSKESKNIAYTRDNNLYVINTANEEISVTADTDKNIVNGQSVHRNEFGIHKGTFWSPNGNLLAFYRMDETPVTDYPLVNVSARSAELINIKYPMAGMKSHHVTVGVFNVKNQRSVFLKSGLPKEKYLTNIAWSPDEKYIYIAELNRGQDTCKLVRYDAASGKQDATLFTEVHPKYVEPQNPIVFLKNNPNLFIWQSRKDGYNHLYLYDTDGILKKQLTTGEWEVTGVLGFDEKGQSLLITSTEDSPIENHIYLMDIKTGKRTKISQEEGVHRAIVSPSGKYLFDIYSSKSNPGKVLLTDVNRNKSKSFFEAKDPYRKVTLPQITLGSLKANDGTTDLYYRLTKPSNFDPSKKYPAIVYVYGGPHSQLVNNSWLGQARGWDIYMAQKGYVVFTLDNRGTSNRGSGFENITHRQLGIVETQDQIAGYEFLKSLPYVDSDKMGVHGWSYGGFMTLNLMLRHPDIFKVGVAGGPVTDWKYYEIMYGERYMDSPEENAKGYSESSMLERAGDLKGRLMLIHGDEDPVVVMQHSLQFLRSAIKAKTHPDFFVYPGHAHNMIGKDRVHLYKHITRYFDDFLKK